MREGVHGLCGRVLRRLLKEAPGPDPLRVPVTTGIELLHLEATSPAAGKGKFKGGQSVRFAVTATVQGLYTDPDHMTLLVEQARQAGTGSLGLQTIVRDALGFYHADVLYPTGITPGDWIARWEATGTATSSNATRELPFTILPWAGP